MHVPVPCRSTGHSEAPLVAPMLLPEILLLCISQQVRVLLPDDARARQDADVLPFWGNDMSSQFKLSNARRLDMSAPVLVHAPAEKSVAASWAVFKNSSRSFSCVTEWRPEGSSVVCRASS